MKKRRIHKKIKALALASVLLFGCGLGDSEDGYVPLAEDEPAFFTIAVADGSTDEYSGYYTEGFLDAAEDLFGEAHFDLIERHVDPASAEKTVLSLAEREPDLILAAGEAALSASAALTDRIPVVGVGVADYAKTLSLRVSSSWNGRTGVNLTGVSSVPSAALMVSLLIEADPVLDGVGLLYVPSDPSCIRQMEDIEALLDEARIPWKEYALSAPAESLPSEDEDALAKGNAISPVKNPRSSFRSSKGSNPVYLDGNGISLGLNTDVSSRTPRQSAIWDTANPRIASTENAQNPIPPDTADDFWDFLNEPEGHSEADSSADSEDASDPSEMPEPAAVSDPDTDGEADGTEDDAGSTSAALSSFETASSEKENDTLSSACAECSVLLLTACSGIRQQAASICEEAHESGAATVTSDFDTGAYTLCSLFADPYNCGYQAGKLAYRILVQGDDAGGIRIASPTDKATAKLYGTAATDALGRSFPKSFSERNAFWEAYKPGAFTTRVTSEETP